MSLQKSLTSWFIKNQRPLPWRKHYHPYEVWVSEIMLQQTQVETALPYFSRWMKQFPTVEALAKSDEKKVLKLWEGLGYYSRARNLHESAKLIVRKHGGVFPDKYEELLALKGVGRYTAGAIASIAFNRENPIVDGNILRVLSRVYAIRKPIDNEKNKALFWKLEEGLIPQGQARNFNQALMELGALVCLPQNPRCAACPIKHFCRAYKENRVNDYPVRQGRRKTVKVEAGSLVLKRNGRYLIRRRPIGTIMGGLWEFPEWKLAKNKKILTHTAQRKVLELSSEEFGGGLGELKPLGRIRRNYTNHIETMRVFLTECDGHAAPSSKNGWPSAWITQREFNKYPFSSAHAKIAQLIKNTSYKNRKV